MIYLWQQKQWQQIWHAKQQDRLPHALLLTGIKGVGKAEFADAFARAMLCQQVTAAGECCNHCRACRLAANHTHPNILRVVPEKSGAAIKVDQIREVSDFIAQSALQGEYKIVIITKADDMNINASNALLKTLEEPSSNSLLILVSDQLERLPATILSRCQRILFPRPSHGEALTWLENKLNDAAIDANLLLQLAEGAPLAALALQKNDVLSVRKLLFDTICILNQGKMDPIKSASNLQSMDILLFIDFNLSFITDLLRLQLKISNEVIINKDYVSQLHALRDHYSMQASMNFMNELSTLRKQACVGINFNKQLLMENVLVKWMGGEQQSNKNKEAICS